MTHNTGNRNTTSAKAQEPTHPSAVAGLSLHFDPGDRAHVHAYRSEQTGKFVLRISDHEHSLIDFVMQGATREVLETTLLDALEAVRAVSEPADAEAGQ